MRILFVAMPASPHTARAVTLLDRTGWDLHLFPSRAGPLNEDLGFVSTHGTRARGPVERVRRFARATARVAATEVRYGNRLVERIVFSPDPVALARLIDRLRPDVVHSMEARAWYLTLEARRLVRRSFPKWIVSDWGHELYLLARLREHGPKIEEILRHCDGYQCECASRETIARALGFTGVTLPAVPTCGGFDLALVEDLRAREAPSVRRLLTLKGYQGGTLSGRALFGLKAVEQCAHLLAGHRIVVFSADDDVRVACELLVRSTGLDVETPSPVPVRQMMALFAQARASIGVSISDGISTSMLEALATGSFPIQSRASCADEWITSGENGLLVEPEDVNDIASAIERAVTDDDLVDRAAVLNSELAVRRLDREKIRRTMIDAYVDFAAGTPR